MKTPLAQATGLLPPTFRLAVSAKLLFAALLAVSASQTFALAPTKEQIAQAVKNLGADDYQARENAEKFLWQAGKAAEAALIEATKSSDAEVVWRAQRILMDFQYGILPETPAEIRQLLRLYRDGDAETKRNVVNQFFERGADGYEWLLRIANAETDEEAKQTVWSRVRQKVSESLPALLKDNKLQEAELLLEAAANSGDELSIRHYTAFLLLHNKIDQKISAWRARHRNAPTSAAGRILVYFFRARGDYEAALKTAEQIDDAKVLEALLREMGDWKRLAAIERNRHPVADEVEHLGLLAAYYRLAGDEKAFEETAAKLRQSAKDNFDRNAVERAAQSLLLNGKWKEGIAVYTENRLYSQAARVLRAQGRFREAAELASRVGESDATEVFNAELDMAGDLLKVGETKRALQMLDKLSKVPRHGHDLDLGLRLVLFERLWGLHDLAVQHAAQFAEEFRDEESIRNLLGTLFYKLEDLNDSYQRNWGTDLRGISPAGEVLWNTLREKSPDEPPSRLLRRVHALMQLEKPNDEILALLKDADRLADKTDATERRKWMWGLSEIHKRLGLSEPAVAYLDKYAEAAVAETGSTLIWSLVGDYLMELKRWKEAAARYERALQQSGNNAVFIYKRGYALAQAGDKKEGEQLMALARVLPLGDDLTRRYLAQTMEQLGRTDEMRREYDTILRTSDFITQCLSPGAYSVTEQLPVIGENLKGATLYDRHLLDCMTLRGATMHQTITEANLLDPYLVHFWRMRGLLDAKQLDAALVNARKCQEYLPADVEVPGRIVPALEAAQRKQDADEIFGVAHDALKKILTEFPNSHTHLSELARLLARCRRSLELAEKHAAKALELAPDAAICHAAIAEVQLARGERARAVESLQRALKLDPLNKEFAQRLKELGVASRQ